MERLRYRSTSLTDLLAEMRERQLLEEATRSTRRSAPIPSRPRWRFLPAATRRSRPTG